MILTLAKLKDEIKRKLPKVNFAPHFYTQVEKRPYLCEEMIIDALKDFDNYLGFQTHFVRGEERHRIGIKISGRYNLVVVIEFTRQDLNIITAWKTSRKWQKAIQK